MSTSAFRSPAASHWWTLLLTFAALALLFASEALAHNVAEGDKGYIQESSGVLLLPFIYLGAKHMVTGYDHLLFLVGVIFFLYRTSEVLKYVSLFTLGHSVTLLIGVWANVPANAYLIDAIIGLSVVYKGFENIGGFEQVFGGRINTQLAVLVFGLFHGFGLATKLQELHLPANGLFANLFSFNVGVEVGQGLALMGILIALGYWRTKTGFTRHAFATNTALMAGGFILMGYQLVGFVVNR